ncbi:DHA2 family efflux MFS transporter permease subunit [Herbidospora sp. RD11066]
MIDQETSATVVGAPSRRRWAVLAVLAAVAFMAQLDLFIVNIALPAMARSFDQSGLNDLSWVLNAYAITFAALLVPMGRLADHVGRRRLLLIGVAVFVVASVICAVAPTLPVLVIGRILQAAGGAMIVPTSLGLLYPSFPKNEHTLVVGIWAGVAAVAAASGPTVGGLLVEFDWRWIFLINVPIGAATIVAGLRLLPESRAGDGARLPDVVSVISLVVGLALLTFALVQSSVWGWADARTLSLLAVAVAAGIVTLRRSIVHPHALIEARLFQSRQFTVATVALFLFFLAFSAWLLLTVLLLQDVWHYGVIQAGLAIAPGPIMSGLLAVNAGRITARFGRRNTAMVGTLLVAAAGLFWFLVTPSHPDYVAGLLPGLIVAGSGVGMTQAPLFATASTLPPDRSTTGSAVLNMSRQVGSAIGVAVLVTLLAAGDGFDGYRNGFLFIVIAALVSSASLAAERLSPQA